MTDTNANITQCFPTIQGEGPSIGTPVLLIRFQGCNLCCKFCDTKWSNINKTLEPVNINNNPPFNATPQSLRQYIINKQFLSDNIINTLMFTGGEPLLNTNFIIEFLRRLPFKNKEIETNGILLSENIKEFKEIQNLTFNISPKLDINCYHNDEFQSTEELIFCYSRLVNVLNRISKNDYYFKLLYSLENEELIKDFIIKSRIMINKINIMALMPDMTKFETHELFLTEYRQSCYQALKFCMKYGIKYTPREHVFLFRNDKNEKLGG